MMFLSSNVFGDWVVFFLEPVCRHRRLIDMISIASYGNVISIEHMASAVFVASIGSLRTTTTKVTRTTLNKRLNEQTIAVHVRYKSVFTFLSRPLQNKMVK